MAIEMKSTTLTIQYNDQIKKATICHSNDTDLVKGVLSLATELSTDLLLGEDYKILQGGIQSYLLNPVSVEIGSPEEKIWIAFKSNSQQKYRSAVIVVSTDDHEPVFSETLKISRSGDIVDGIEHVLTALTEMRYLPVPWACSLMLLSTLQSRFSELDVDKPEESFTIKYRGVDITVFVTRNSN